jgi:hypothetical protein
MIRKKRSTSKYHAKKTIVDGIKFDSKKEALHYSELKLLQTAGIIKSFTCQPVFLLQDKYKRKDGKSIRDIRYIADFRVEYMDGHIEIEDVKSYGTITPVFKIKQKMLEKLYPDINFKVVL